ncbi:MAG: hypothetical protein ACJ710_05175 [Ornithinibacter sp.]
MRRLAVILTAAATVGAALTAVPAQAAPLPSPPTTGYAFFTAPRAGVDWGTRFQATSAISGSSAANGGVTVAGTGAGAAVESTVITPPTGQTFAAGTTYDVKESATATAAGVALTGVTVPAECAGATSGTLTVHEVTTAGAGITAFAGSVRGTCGSGAPGIGFAQEVRFNSTVPLIVLSAPVSTPKAEVVTVAAGASDVTFGTAAGTGVDTKIAISADTCSGTTVLAGATCALTLTATPDFFGPAQDVITLPDGSTTGRTIPVTVNGFDTATGAYTPLNPTRLLDTRRALGVTTRTPVGPGQVAALQVTGRGGVPAAGATAVVLNVTVVAPTAAGFVTLYPAGGARPTASSVNFNAGFTGANLVTVKLGTGGKVSIYNKSGSTHVVADVMGYYHAATSAATAGYGGYSGIEPTRILDSRDPQAGALLPNEFYTTGIDFGPEVNPHIKGYAVNITATGTTGSGFFTAWNGDPNAIPSTSTLNFTPGRTVPNMAVVPTSACGADCGPGFESIPIVGVLNSSSGSAHVIVDLVGYYDDNTLDGMWRFRPLAGPSRIVNTTTGQGIPSALGVGGIATVTNTAAVTTFNSMALVTNTTANKPTRNTVLTLWNADITKPTVSNLNPAAGQLVSNMTITDLGAAYDFKVRNTSGSTNLVIDVAGTMETYPAVADPGAAAALRTTGLSALRKDSSVRATGDPRATAPTLHGTPFSSTAQHR